MTEKKSMQTQNVVGLQARGVRFQEEKVYIKETDEKMD